MHLNISNNRKPRLSIIIPAYNEELRISTTLNNLLLYLDKIAFKGYELLVIVNGSIDRTLEIVKQFKRVKAYNHPEQIGKGGAIRVGLSLSSASEAVGFLDADESTSPADFLKLYKALFHYSADCAIASRYAKGAVITKKQPLRRIFFSRGYNWLFAHLIFGLNISDTQCGAKVFRKSALDEVKSKLSSNGFEIDLEMLWHLKRKRKKIIEIPIRWKHEEYSTFSLKKIPRMFISTLRMLIRGVVYG